MLEIKKLQIIYGRELTQEQLNLWCEIFSEYEEEKFKKGIKNAILTCKFFPSISEMNEFIQQPTRRLL